MRTLSATLKSNQMQGGIPLGKVVLVKGATRYAYTTEDRLIDGAITEEGIMQKADIFLNNYDGALTALNLRGYTLTVHRGFRTGVSRTAWAANTAYSVDDIRVPTTANSYQYRCTVAGTSHAATEPTWPTTLGAIVTDGTVTWEMDGNSGDEYSYLAPLTVIAPDMLSSARSGVQIVYSAIGTGNQMSMDRATADYFPLSTNTDTIKTIINAILGATLACFNHCTVITVVWDSEDDIIDTYAPADAFRVHYRETRKDKVEEVLSWTKCVGRFEKDGKFHIRKLNNAQASTWVANTAYTVNDMVKPTTANGHIYKCTVAGTSHATTEPTWPTTEGNTVTDGTVTWTLFYDYTYNDVETNDGTNHLFWSDSHRQRIVLPNEIRVESDPSHTPSYTGTATDSDSNALLDVLDPYRMRLPSNAMAAKIANAKLVNFQRAAERGSASVPMNVGQEMYDLVKLTDSRSGAVQFGNVGYMFSHLAPREFNLSLRLGSPSMGVPMGLTSPTALSSNQGNTQELASWAQENFQRLWNAISRIGDQIQFLADSVASLLDRTLSQTAITRGIGVIAVDATTDVTVGDGKLYIPILALLHNMNLFRAQAIVITAGTTNATTIDIYNVTDSVDMLSTAISIASGATVGTVGTIDTTKDDVAVNDVLRIDVTTASTTKPKGLLVVLEFSLP